MANPRLANLRLVGENPADDRRDSIPFPAVSRIGKWDPRPARPGFGRLELTETQDPTKQVERTLDDMDRKLAGLRELLGPGFDDDHGPRAA
jgi:hypothetical protein